MPTCLNQFRQLFLIKSLYRIYVIVANLVCPIGIGKQRTTHGDKIKLVCLHAADKLIDACNFCSAITIGCDKLFSQTNTANADSWLARNLFHPTGKIQGRAFELWLPESSVAAVEDVHSGIGQGAEKLFQLFGCLRQPRFEVLLLPLLESQNHREVVADLTAYGLHDLNREACALG